MIAAAVEATVAAVKVVVCGGNAQRCSEDCGNREEMHGGKNVFWACVLIAAVGGSLKVRNDSGKATQKEDTKAVTASCLQNDSKGNERKVTRYQYLWRC